MSGVDLHQYQTCLDYASDRHAQNGVGVGSIGVEHSTIIAQPKRYGKIQVTTPQPDYLNWSTASLFICFVWGIFAYRASNRVRKFNKMRAYDQAAHYSEQALRYNRSAVACSILMFLIIGVPLIIALIAQGLPSKFPNARTYFG